MLIFCIEIRPPIMSLTRCRRPLHRSEAQIFTIPIVSRADRSLNLTIRFLFWFLFCLFFVAMDVPELHGRNACNRPRNQLFDLCAEFDQKHLMSNQIRYSLFQSFIVLDMSGLTWSKNALFCWENQFIIGDTCLQNLFYWEC